MKTLRTSVKNIIVKKYACRDSVTSEISVLVDRDYIAASEFEKIKTFDGFNVVYWFKIFYSDTVNLVGKKLSLAGFSRIRVNIPMTHW